MSDIAKPAAGPAANPTEALRPETETRAGVSPGPVQDASRAGNLSASGVAVILLVEDNEKDIQRFRRALAHLRVASPLAVVKDETEAMAYLSGADPFADRSRHPLPSVVVLDLQSPGSQGVGLLEWIRANPRLKDLPVSVMTGSTHILDVKKRRQWGARAVPVSPGDFGALLEMVRRIKIRWQLPEDGPDPARGPRQKPQP